MTFDKKEYTKKYNDDKYDEIKLRVPKGKKDEIKEYVAKYDLVSVGAYLNMLIIQDMEKKRAEEENEEILSEGLPEVIEEE